MEYRQSAQLAHLVSQSVPQVTQLVKTAHQATTASQVRPTLSWCPVPKVATVKKASLSWLAQLEPSMMNSTLRVSQIARLAQLVIRALQSSKTRVLPVVKDITALVAQVASPTPAQLALMVTLRLARRTSTSAFRAHQATIAPKPQVHQLSPQQATTRPCQACLAWSRCTSAHPSITARTRP